MTYVVQSARCTHCSRLFLDAGLQSCRQHLALAVFVDVCIVLSLPHCPILPNYHTSHAHHSSLHCPPDCRQPTHCHSLTPIPSYSRLVLGPGPAGGLGVVCLGNMGQPPGSSSYALVAPDPSCVTVVSQSVTCGTLTGHALPPAVWEHLGRYAQQLVQRCQGLAAAAGEVEEEEKSGGGMGVVDGGGGLGGVVGMRPEQRVRLEQRVKLPDVADAVRGLSLWSQPQLRSECAAVEGCLLPARCVGALAAAELLSCTPRLSPTIMCFALLHVSHQPISKVKHIPTSPVSAHPHTHPPPSPTLSPCHAMPWRVALPQDVSGAFAATTPHAHGRVTHLLRHIVCGAALGHWKWSLVEGQVRGSCHWGQWGEGWRDGEHQSLALCC